MFNHDDTVTGNDQRPEVSHQALNIGRMKSTGGLIKNIQRVIVCWRRQLRGQLGTLCFSAGKRVGRLTERDISQSNTVECRQDRMQTRELRKEFCRFVNTHLQHVSHRLIAKSNAANGLAETKTMTDSTWHDSIRQKTHADIANADSPAFRAASFAGVKAEMPGVQSP